MRQLHLPMFPSGVTQITAELAFWKQDGEVTYFNGHLPVFCHPENDIATFRMITSQFCVNGGAKQSDIIRAYVDQREAVGEGLSGERAEGILRPTRHPRCGGTGRYRGGGGGKASCRWGERRRGCRDA
jgi:hypothetical protein